MQHHKRVYHILGLLSSVMSASAAREANGFQRARASAPSVGRPPARPDGNPGRLSQPGLWGLARWELPILLAVAPLLLWAGSWSAVALLVLGALWLRRRVTLGRFTVSSGIDAPIGLLFLLSLLGLYVSPDRSRSLPALYRLALGVALFYGLVNGVTNQRTACRVAVFLSLGGMALALIALAATDWRAIRLVPLPIYRHFPRLPLDLGNGELFNPRIVGMALGMLIPLPLASLLFAREGRMRLLSGAVALAMAVTFLLTQSIQGALGLAAGLLLLATWKSRWFLLAIPLGLAAAVGTVRVLDPRQVALALLSVDHPLGVAVLLRLDMWGRALAMLRDLPYTGIGLDTFPLVQTQFYPGLLLGPEPHAHSLYLQVALDLGLPGLACFFWLIGLVAGRVAGAWRRRPQGELDALLAGSSASLVSFLASGLVDTLWTAKPAILFWVLLGMTAPACRLLAQEDSHARTASSARVTRWPPVPGLLLALLVLSLLAFPRLGLTNWALVQAHRGLVEARAGGNLPQATLRSAARGLEGALARTPASPSVWRTLGGVYAWLGEDERALECLAQAVAPDVQDPLGRYAPFEVWRRSLQGEEERESWKDLLWVYGYWMRRFPQRAEGYVQTALVWERYGGDPARAVAVLEQGLEKNARPEGLLLYHLARLRREER